MEAAGRKVRYLNIGDPITFGFKTPPHLIEAVERAMRDGHNGYAPSVGIAAGARSGGRRVRPARHAGDAGPRRHHRRAPPKGIELALTALAGARRRGARPGADLSALHRGARQDRRASRSSTGTDPDTRWLPDLDHIRSLIDAAHARAGRHRSEQSDGRDLSRATCGARCSRSPTSTTSRCSPTRSTPTSRSTARSPRSRGSNPDAPVITFSSLSKAYLAPGWRAGWLAVGRTRAARRRARRDQEAGGRPPVQHRADGIRDRRGADRRPLAPAARSARRCANARELTTQRLNAIDGHVGRARRRGVLRHAEGRAAAGQDRRGLRARAAARDRRALRLRLGLRRPGPRTASSASSSSPRPPSSREIYDLIARVHDATSCARGSRSDRDRVADGSRRRTRKRADPLDASG